MRVLHQVKIVGFEFRSRRTVLGVPWIHIAFGCDPYTGRRRVAKGVVAVGQIAIGVISIGQIATGVIAIGQLAVGVLFGAAQLAFAYACVGQLAVGGALALGQFAVGPGGAGAAVWAESPSVLALAAAWTIAGVTLAGRSRRQFGAVGRLLAPSRARVREAPPGQVVVAGRVVAGRTVEAPVSGRLCIAYDVRRLALDRAPRAESHCEDFLVDDGTGAARIVAADTKLLLEPRRSTARVVEADCFEAWGGRGAPRPMERRRQASARVVEQVLLPGEEVVVAGLATRVVDGADGRIVIHGGASGPVLVTNRDLAELRAESALGAWLALVLFAAEATLLLL